LRGCDPQTVGRSNFSAKQPILYARDLINSCDGFVVIAFERTRIIQGLDEPGGPNQRTINNESHPTVWNQLEAAMAYARNVPILSFVQIGLRRQGMLSDRLEWFAQETDLKPEFLQTTQFEQTFQDWLARVEEGRTNPKGTQLDPAKIQIRDLVTRLSPPQIWAVATAFMGFFAGVAGIAFKFGQYFHGH
jgi:hypothetical protein